MQIYLIKLNVKRYNPHLVQPQDILLKRILRISRT